MNFTFTARPQVEICGAKYDVDITDVAFITSLVTSYSGMLRRATDLQALQQAVVEAAGTGDEEAMAARAQDVAEANRALYECAKAFIVGALGEEAYHEIFSQRKPNSAEHVQLCAHIYGEVLAQRAAVVAPYISPPGDGRDKGGKRAAPAKNHRGKQEGKPR